jgi:putative nucleotidyltransferase with HDIG domain
MNKYRILLADVDESFLFLITDYLKFHRSHWQVIAVRTALELTDHIQRNPFDAVIADSAFPDFRPGELLAAVAVQCPAAIRLSLSGNYDRDVSLKIMRHAHQNLWKPCAPEEICETLTRCFALKTALNHDRLQLLITQIDTLPSLPRLYLEFLDEVRKPNPSSSRLSDILKQDISLCAKTLQLVNSAFFGLPHKIENPEEALLYLGLENVKALVLSIQVFSLYDKVKLHGIDLESLWSHSWETGRIARQIATFEKRPSDEIETAFTAGLLHDIGKLVLASGVPRTWKKILETAASEGMTLWQAEQQILGTTHAEVGASLLATWGLSDQLVEAVAFHHHPEHSGASNFSPLTAVYAANLLADKEFSIAPAQNEGEPAYLELLKLEDHVPEWRERFVEAA